MKRFLFTVTFTGHEDFKTGKALLKKEFFDLKPSVSQQSDESHYRVGFEGYWAEKERAEKLLGKNTVISWRQVA